MLSSQTQQTTLSKPKRIEELAFITNSFLSLHNLSREIEVLRLRDKSQMNDSKGSLFITADEKGNESASLFPSFNRRKNRNATLQVESELKQPTKSSHGLLPRIKQRVNNEMLGELNELEKNNVAIRREMDSYLYKNRQLAKKLKELKIIQHSGLSQAKNEQKMHEKRQKIA